MRKITLYSAMSLDGYIARPDGNIDWLNNYPNPENLDYGYTQFIGGIDTTLMGNKTYQLVLSFDIPWPYPDKTNYVFTRSSAHTDTEYVRFISGDIVAFVKSLQQQPGGSIWLIGGGEINHLLLQHDLIDELIIHVIPVVLGRGIPLFKGEVDLEKKFQLTATHGYYNSVLELKYGRG